MDVGNEIQVFPEFTLYSPGAAVVLDCLRVCNPSFLIEFVHSDKQNLVRQLLRIFPPTRGEALASRPYFEGAILSAPI
jgi:hypothetical protein